MGLRGGASNGNTDSLAKAVIPTPGASRSVVPQRNSSNPNSTITAVNTRIPRSVSKSNDLLSLVAAANGLSEGVVDSFKNTNTTETQNAKSNNDFTFIKPVAVPTDEQSIVSVNSSSMYSTQSITALNASSSTNRIVKSSKSSYKRPRSSRSRSTKSRRSAANSKKRSVAALSEIADEALAAKEDEDDIDYDDEDEDDQIYGEENNHTLTESNGSEATAVSSLYVDKIKLVSLIFLSQHYLITITTLISKG